MLYNLIDDVDDNMVNERIKDAISEWGTLESFFNSPDIHYSRQAFNDCVRKGKIPPLSVLLEIAKKLNCDMGYLLCEYNERHHVIADVKEATGLETEVINIILNMKNSFLKLSILNELLQDDYFLAIIDLLYMADYHREKGKELNNIEDRVRSDYDAAETPEEKAKFKKRYCDYRNEHRLHDANVLANCYRLTTAFSRLIDKRYKPLPEINTSDIEARWKQEHIKKEDHSLF
ncbi:MAG: hypothetical protein HFI39_01315 [Lachnospiraceae bacterium]|nr:hypothetical protein [Lachnospiraceae bacterium]